MSALRDALRLIHLSDVLYQLGNLLYRRSLRYTLLTVGIALLGYFANFLGINGFTVRQALTLPIIVGGSTLLGGLLLKLIPAIIAARQMTIAQASDLNLMEDYRKSAAEEHLEALWDRVYRHEVGEREDFMHRAERCLRESMPQTRERYEIGLNLHLLEDWYDGAYFDRSDLKLMQQYDGNVALGRARRRAGLTLLASLGDLPGRLKQRVWFLLTTRAVAIHVADAVDRLNRRWDTDDFNAQTLLWPGEEDAGWLERYPGSRDALLVRRRRFVRRLFGADKNRARIMIYRLFGMNLRLATRLRLHVDPEYLLGRLGPTPARDLDEVGWPARDPLRRLVARLDRRTRPALERFADALDEAGATDPPAVRRAALVAHHAHHHGHGRRRPPPPDPPEPARWLALAREEYDSLTTCLVLVRQHQELARLEHQSYLHLIAALRKSAN